MNKPSVNIGLETRRVITIGPNKGLSHIKLWVTFKVAEDGKWVWKQRPYKTNLFCTPQEFAIVADKTIKRVSTKIGDLRSLLTEIEARANHIIEKLKGNTQKKFELYFLSNHSPESLALHYEIKQKELLEMQPEPKISSEEKYRTSLKSLQEFFGEDVTFHSCTPQGLREYEAWYTNQDHGKKKKSLTSVGINLRHLRHIFKRVIKDGIVHPDLYPFGAGPDDYIIPEGGDDTKKFMEVDEKEKFMIWTSPNDNLMELYDYAVFSYFAYGLNFADIAKLRKPDLKVDYISKDRQKSKRRKKKMKPLVIPMHDRMLDVIKRRGNKNLIPNDFVFPILNDSMTPKEKFLRIRKLVDDTNDVLALIAKDLKMKIKPTTYTLRHSFAKQFMEMGGTTEELQDALGHGNIKTTEAYKHGFGLEKKKKFSAGL